MVQSPPMRYFCWDRPQNIIDMLIMAMTINRQHIATLVRVVLYIQGSENWLYYEGKIVPLYDTVQRCYYAVQCIKISHMALRWQGRNINQTLNSKQTPHSSTSWVSYGVSVARKIDCIIMALHCHKFPPNAHNKAHVTAWGTLKVLNILNIFSFCFFRKNCAVQLKFHWRQFLGVKMKVSHHWFG